MISATDDASVLNNDGADHGIWAGPTPALRCETKRQGHEVEMRCGGSHRVLRVTRDWLRSRLAEFVFVVFTVAFLPFTRAPDSLRVVRLDPASANTAWAAASRAMGMR